jgi:hypothetical protein
MLQGSRFTPGAAHHDFTYSQHERKRKAAIKLVGIEDNVE